LSGAAEALAPAQVAAYNIPVKPAGLVADSRKPEVFDPDVRVLHFTLSLRKRRSAPSWGGPITPRPPGQRTPRSPPISPATSEMPSSTASLRTARSWPPGSAERISISTAHRRPDHDFPSVTVRDPYLDKEFKTPSHDKARALGRQLAAHILPVLSERTRCRGIMRPSASEPAPSRFPFQTNSSCSPLSSA